MADIAVAPLAFESFFQDTYPRLARACYLLTGGAAEAEDLAQEAMSRAYERWDRVSKMDSPEGYVYRIAMNLNRKRTRSLFVRERKSPPPPPEPRDPADLAVARDEVQVALAALPLGQREALILVGWFGLDAKSAGKVLGIDPVTVRSRLHRGRQVLRDTLGDADV